MIDPTEKILQTIGGGVIHPHAALFEEISLDDVAHALGMQVRWTGHVKKFYSIAQHAVYVSILAEAWMPEAALWGLHHDDPEYVLGDVATPLKEDSFRVHEDRLAKVIRWKLDIPCTVEINRVMKRADMDMLFMERDHITAGHLFDYTFEHEHPGTKLTEVFPDFEYWSPERAKREYLARHKQLVERLKV